MRSMLVSGFTLMLLVGSQALAEEATLTGDEIQQMLIGNSSKYDTQWGYAENYRDPDGTFYVRNSQGRRGKGKWNIDGDKLCMKWTETSSDWRTSDFCSTFTKISDDTVKTDRGTIQKLQKGDPTKIKLVD